MKATLTFLLFFLLAPVATRATSEPVRTGTNKPILLAFYHPWHVTVWEEWNSCFKGDADLIAHT
jgi:hypothetical protein